MRTLLFILILTVDLAHAADISNPMKLMFVGDRSENLIDVVSLEKGKRIHRIKTSVHPDNIIATPYAPILMYTNTAAKKAVFYDLKKQQETKTLDTAV